MISKLLAFCKSNNKKVKQAANRTRINCAEARRIIKSTSSN